jgi:hypothetical protein
MHEEKQRDKDGENSHSTAGRIFFSFELSFFIFHFELLNQLLIFNTFLTKSIIQLFSLFFSLLLFTITNYFHTIRVLGAFVLLHGILRVTLFSFYNVYSLLLIIYKLCNIVNINETWRFFENFSKYIVYY